MAGRFETGNLLCQDSFGGYYECTDKETGQALFVRIFGSTVVLGSTVALPDHPCLTPLEFVADPGAIPRFAVFHFPEVVRLVSLREWMQKNRRPPIDKMVAILTPLLQGLHAMHVAGQPWGQVMPEMIAVGETAENKLQARLLTVPLDDASRVPARDYYRAPEQLGATPALSPQSDQWAVGIIMYEMLYGRRAFVGRNNDEVVQKIIQAQPDFPVLTGYPPEVVAFVRRALTGDPAARWPSVEAAATEMQQWAAAGDAKAAPQTSAAAPATAPATKAATPTAATPQAQASPPMVDVASASAPASAASATPAQPAAVPATAKTVFGAPAVLPPAAPAQAPPAAPAQAPPATTPPAPPATTPPAAPTQAPPATPVTPPPPPPIERVEVTSSLAPASDPLFADLHTTEISLQTIDSAAAAGADSAARHSTTVNIDTDDLESVSMTSPPGPPPPPVGSAPTTTKTFSPKLLIAGILGLLLWSALAIGVYRCATGKPDDTDVTPAGESTPLPDGDAPTTPTPAPQDSAKVDTAAASEASDSVATSDSAGDSDTEPKSARDTETTAPEDTAETLPASEEVPTPPAPEPKVEKPVAAPKPAPVKAPAAKPKAPVKKKPRGLADNPFGN